MTLRRPTLTRGRTLPLVALVAQVALAVTSRAAWAATRTTAALRQATAATAVRVAQADSSGRATLRRTLFLRMISMALMRRLTWAVDAATSTASLSSLMLTTMLGVT